MTAASNTISIGIYSTHIAMAEFLWKDPVHEEDYQIVALPDGVQAPSASSAPTAAQWISMHKDLQQTQAAWRNMRDERVLKKVTEQTAIATQIAEENKRLRAEEKMQKGRGLKEPHDPGPNICPECGKNTWDLMTLGTCDACGMWKALWEEKKENDKEKKENAKEPRGKKKENKAPPGPRICPECKRNTWDLLTLGTCDACGMWKAYRDSFKKSGAQRDNYYNDQSSDEENQKAPQAETKAKATAKTKAAAGAGRPHRFDNKQQHAAYSSSSSSRWQPPPPPPPASSAWQ